MAITDHNSFPNDDWYIARAARHYLAIKIICYLYGMASSGLGPLYQDELVPKLAGKHPNDYEIPHMPIKINSLKSLQLNRSLTKMSQPFYINIFLTLNTLLAFSCSPDTSENH